MSENGANIPDGVRRRLKKLLALASDGRGNEAEASAAAAKVQALMAEYNLEMAQLTEGEQEGNPDATREKISCVLEASEPWQERLLVAITRNNFCLVYQDANRRKVRNLVGRSVNIFAAIELYVYLTAAIERLCPFPAAHTRKHASWKDGCSDRLVLRLNEQRWAAERQQAEVARGTGSDLVLADVYSTEEDLNRDFRYGYPAGTTARERIEREARWAAQAEARRNAPQPPAPVETAVQRQVREANERRWAREWAVRRRAEERKRDADAYAMGDEAGASISLNRQVEQEEVRQIA